ncbi:MAG: hypothetical protein LBP62_03355 [Clostridiales bacterium]|jgi:RNA polymerase subunit RPABC4/transcription elongation factor Spt4|nr:hypothetical protein [Clostridiales bacterium]
MRICEHCGAYVGDGTAHCTICGGNLPASAARAYGFAVDADSAPAKLAEINSKLNKGSAQTPAIAPYVGASDKRILPTGAAYSCKNCATINSVDDIYCVACGVRASDKTIKEALKAAQNGDFLLPQPEPAPAVPDFGEETGFSTSLNTLEAALKPYIYNLTINGDNTELKVSPDKGAQTVCPFAPENRAAQETRQFEEEAPADEYSPSPGDIERQRGAVLKAAGKHINERVRDKRRIVSLIGLIAAFLVAASFFSGALPYTARHLLDKEPIPVNDLNIKESAGIDIIVSLAEILHFDDLYEAAVNSLEKLGVDMTAAYYKDVVMDLENYTYWQKWSAYAVPFTLLAAFIFAVLNAALFAVKVVTGNLKRKFYFISVVSIIFFVLAFAEIYLMNMLNAGVFDFDWGYGLIAAITLNVVVLIVERFGGKKYPPSEKDRFRSLYGY